MHWEVTLHRYKLNEALTMKIANSNFHDIGLDHFSNSPSPLQVQADFLFK